MGLWNLLTGAPNLLIERKLSKFKIKILFLSLISIVKKDESIFTNYSMILFEITVVR